MLNSAKPEIFPVHKCWHVNHCWHLTFMSRKNSIQGLHEPEKWWISWYFYTYEHLKFHAQLSWAWNFLYNRHKNDTFYGVNCSFRWLHVNLCVSKISSIWSESYPEKLSPSSMEGWSPLECDTIVCGINKCYLVWRIWFCCERNKVKFTMVSFSWRKKKTQ